VRLHRGQPARLRQRDAGAGALARSFDVGQSAIGLAIAIYGLARLLVAVPAGQIADRAGRRGALALGGLVTAASNLLCACAPTYPAFITARFIDGAGVRAVRVGHLVLGALDYRQSPKRIMDNSRAEHVVPPPGAASARSSRFKSISGLWPTCVRHGCGRMVASG
jgi:hypothetical protein